MNLNRYDHENIKHSIDGYMVGRHPTETREQEFNKAKAELLAQLKLRIEQIQVFTFADMSKKVS